MAGGTAGTFILFQIIFIQDVFAILIIVVTVQAFICLHMVFVREIDCRSAFTAVGRWILNIDFVVLGI